jgi:hypothetical protein
VDDETDGRNTFWYEENCIKYTKKVVNFINIPHYIAKTPENPNTLMVGKTVNGSTSEKNKSFTFDIYLYKKEDGASTYTAVNDVTLTYADGTTSTTAFTSGTYSPISSSYRNTYAHATVTMKDGQTIQLSGMPDGYGFIVIEKYDSSFTSSVPGKIVGVEDANLDVNKDSSKNLYVAATSVTGKNASFTFVNSGAGVGTDTLTVGKSVYGPETNEGQTYQYDIYLQGATYNSYYYSYSYTCLTGEFTLLFNDGEKTWTETRTATAVKNPYRRETDASVQWGNIEVRLKDGETVTVLGLPDNYRYYVVERWPSVDELYTVAVAEKPSAATFVAENGIVYEDYVASQDDTTVIYENQYPKLLTLRKEIAGSLASADDEFTFTVTLTDDNGSPITSAVQVLYEGMYDNYLSYAEYGDEVSNYATYANSTSTAGNTDRAKCPVTGSRSVYTYMYGYINPRQMVYPDSYGRVTVTLKGGEYATLCLPLNYHYTIVETDAKDYSTSIKVEGEGTIVNSDRKVILTSGQTASDNTVVTYTNTKNQKMGTGIALDVLPYVFLAVSASAVLAGWLYCRKRKHSD